MKIIISIFIGIVLIYSNLVSTEIDEIRPQTLCYESLPENYDQTLDELFQTYNEIFQIVKNSGSSLKEREQFASDYMTNMPKKDLFRMAYLHILAANTIPDYYYEFIYLNTPREYGNLFSKEIRLEKSIYTDEIIEFFYNRTDASEEFYNYYVPGLYIITYLMKKQMLEYMPELGVLLNIPYDIFLKAKVLSFETYYNTLDKNGLMNHRHLCEIEILDSFFDLNLPKNILIRGYSRKPDQKLEIGETYLIGIGYHFDAYEIAEFKNYNGKDLTMIPVFGFGINSSFLIKDKNIFRNITKRSESFSSRLNRDIFDDAQSIDYDKFKAKQLKLIKKLNKGVE